MPLRTNASRPASSRPSTSSTYSRAFFSGRPTPRIGRSLCGWRRRSRPAAFASAPACARSATTRSSFSGFFSDSLRRRTVDVGYYASIGGMAYAALSRHETETFSPVFAELATKFVGFADVLSEVSERAGCTASNASLLRLFEQWLATGSARSGQRLLERGVLPNPAARTNRIQ